jgi:hypothetical protein
LNSGSSAYVATQSSLTSRKVTFGEDASGNRASHCHVGRDGAECGAVSLMLSNDNRVLRWVCWQSKVECLLPNFNIVEDRFLIELRESLDIVTNLIYLTKQESAQTGPVPVYLELAEKELRRVEQTIRSKEAQSSSLL